MVYKFKSKEAGDLFMLEPSGRQILEIIGKEAGRQGIILPEQMPAAIEALEAAIALEKSADKAADAAQGEGVVGLHQRALPFIDMLRRNHKAGHEVVWGV